MEQIIETGAVTRGWFGVEVANITPELAESLGLSGTKGAIVGGIERGSPAERAGIRLGDVILAVGERNVQDLTATLNAIADIPPGKTVQVKVARKNQEVTLAVTVGTLTFFDSACGSWDVGAGQTYIESTGEVLNDATWAKRKDEWLPSTSDGDFISELMQPCFQNGEYAPWIAPPKIGIDNKPGEFEYVKIHE